MRAPSETAAAPVSEPPAVLQCLLPSQVAYMQQVIVSLLHACLQRLLLAVCICVALKADILKSH